MSTRNIFWGSKGGRCVKLKSLPPSCADEIWEPESSRTLRAYQACRWMDLPFFHILIFFTNPYIDLPNDLFPSSFPTKILHASFSTLILRRSRTGMVWFYTSTSNKRAARPKLYTKSLTRDLKLMYSRLTLVRMSINL